MIVELAEDIVILFAIAYVIGMVFRAYGVGDPWFWYASGFLALLDLVTAFDVVRRLVTLEGYRNTADEINTWLPLGFVSVYVGLVVMAVGYAAGNFRRKTTDG